jgi:aldehyde:ferredoxin oxidoreductase
MPGYHPRGLQSMGIGLAVGSRGADHNRSGAYELDLTGAVDRFQVDIERIPLLIERENHGAIMDSLILCRFIRRAVRDLYAEAAEMLTALTGHPFAAEDIARTADDIQALKKRFNQRQGWSEAEDTLPARFFREPDGSGQGIDRAQFGQARAEYYRLRGWDADGRLAPESCAGEGLPPAGRPAAQRSIPLGRGRGYYLAFTLGKVSRVPEEREARLEGHGGQPRPSRRPALQGSSGARNGLSF